MHVRKRTFTILTSSDFAKVETIEKATSQRNSAIMSGQQYANRLIRIFFGCTLALSFSAWSKTPQEIFEAVAPSIVVVESFDASNQPISFGSGVVISLGEVVTNCHVVEKGSIFGVKQGETAYQATIRYADNKRDLCQLTVSGLKAPSVKFGSVVDLKVGERVVAIGAPQGWELSISEGLVSALREHDSGSKLIQTSAPISPGSSGGGLFNRDGLLVGITTLFIEDSQNLNFAVPVDWIWDLPFANTGKLQEEKVSNLATVQSKGLEEIASLGKRLRANDPDFEAKLKYLTAFIKSTVSAGTPPSEWAAIVEKYYWSLPDGDSLQSTDKFIGNDFESLTPSDFDLLMQKAEQGDAAAQFNLGNMYLDGIGVQKNRVKAEKLYRLSAEQGVSNAQTALANLIGSDQFAQPDYLEAFQWARLAAEQGGAIAQLNLGRFYADGKGVPQNFDLAMEWFRKAAYQGFAPAQATVGSFYALGKGVPQSYLEASVWFTVAAAYGYEGAENVRGGFAGAIAPERIKKIRDGLVKELSPNALKVAQQRAAKLFEEIEARKALQK